MKSLPHNVVYIPLISLPDTGVKFLFIVTLSSTVVSGRRLLTLGCVYNRLVSARLNTFVNGLM